MIDFSGNHGGGGGGTTITNVVCTNAANTPAGVTWTNAGETVTGTLAASAAVKDNRYFVPSGKTKTKNVYKEYLAVLVGSNYVWEELGTVDLDLDGYVRFDQAQTLTAEQKAQAKANIGVDFSPYRTSSEQDVIDAGKIDAPASGTTGQVLKKTASGTEWGNVAEGMSDDEKLIAASAFNDTDDRLWYLEHGQVKKGITHEQMILESDVIDSLKSTLTKKPLSAKQGNELKKINDANEDVIAAAINDLAYDRLPATVIAQAYDTHSTYSVGDYRVHNNTLYKCTTAIATPEFFDSTKWQATTVIEVILNL